MSPECSLPGNKEPAAVWGHIFWSYNIAVLQFFIVMKWKPETTDLQKVREKKKWQLFREKIQRIGRHEERKEGRREN